MQALLVVDMLKDFVYPRGALTVPGAGELVGPINEKIAEFRKNGEPVIFVRDSHEEGDEEFQVWGAHAVEGTWGAEIIDELDLRESAAQVKKKRFSAFFNTTLEEVLRERGIDTLVITGVLTNICVLHTAADARMRGYRVKVPRCCVYSGEEESNRWALKHIEGVLGGEVV